ncbi:cellulase family glycosylhydrolase [Hymenobacter taeanensis]|uniref:Arabinogalactan endo-beta-1,4-galactanase n=1 Tax=Hymenobacter taeanensis TaxID=2735321 RepID=A0A6M6BLI4_9BACT|nr:MULTISPECIES: glycosyl hydrolase 53 family protein [Hymenobacter]QJX48698.1 cellulase family glycosylhydrolase [Hymenobacter taeanensis]UOQ81802.1 arabinogalactan endo-1,4-beta-galactosidase [Hymenobacter sp. 5414T-23]
MKSTLLPRSRTTPSWPATRVFCSLFVLLWLGAFSGQAQSAKQPAHSSLPVRSAADQAKPGKMLGADISFLPQLEARGITFSDKGKQKDAIQILKDHGFNYVRLRLFHNPAADSGYSPDKGFCDLAHTQQMATRVKQAGLKFLLDFHYSDTWADPQKQFKPEAWKDLHGAQLEQAVHNYTRDVLLALKAQGTLPDMVQVGNEINHGLLWPDGDIHSADSVARLDNLAGLLKAGVAAVRETAPQSLIIMHIALGGQNEQSVYWLDNMFARGVTCDVIGQSYYPRWHRTLPDLQRNLTSLARRYPQDIVVVEYSELKREVNNIAFTLPNHKGKGTFIWEPLNTWEQVFDKEGKANELLGVYDEIHKKFKVK